MLKTYFFIFYSLSKNFSDVELQMDNRFIQVSKSNSYGIVLPVRLAIKQNRNTKASTCNAICNCFLINKSYM